jgi:predicted cobalt transporter CbtA
VSLAGSLRRGLAAGLAAGLLAALFAFVVAEPVMDRAIALEDSRAAAAAHDATHAPGDTPHSHADDPPVSRDTQRRVGAPLGFVLIGAALGTLFGLLYGVARRRSPRLEPWPDAVAVGGSMFAGLQLVPFVVYPASPPGAGDANSVSDRTSHYLAAVVLGLSAVVGAWLLVRALARRGWSQPRRHVATAAAFVVLVGAGYAVLPAAEPADVPADLLWDFRLAALGTQLVLWSALVAVFGLLSDRAAAPAREGDRGRVTRQPA